MSINIKKIILESELYTQLAKLSVIFSVSFLISIVYLANSDVIEANHTNLSQDINNIQPNSSINTVVVKDNLDQKSINKIAHKNLKNDDRNIEHSHSVNNSQEKIDRQNDIELSTLNIKSDDNEIIELEQDLLTENILIEVNQPKNLYSSTISPDGSKIGLSTAGFITVQSINSSVASSTSNNPQNNPSVKSVSTTASLPETTITIENAEILTSPSSEQEISRNEPTLNVLETKTYYDDPIVCPPLTQFREEWREGAAAIQRQYGCLL